MINSSSDSCYFAEWECLENGWKLFGTDCYKYVDTKGTYHEVKQKCANDHGAEVVSIRNVDEMSFVAGMCLNFHYHSLFLR